MPPKTGRRTLFLALLMCVGLVSVPSPANATFPGPRGEIAFVRIVGGVAEIHGADPLVQMIDPPERTIVALPGRDAVQPTWSADGSKLAFAARPSPEEPFAIYTSDADGGSIQQITSASLGDTNPAWSPDETRIAFSRLLPSGLHAIFISNAEGSAAAQLTDGTRDEMEPAWSPSGSEIAYAARIAPLSVCPDCLTHSVFVRNADGTGLPTELVPSGSSLDLRDPDWSPDGSRIAFSIGDGTTTFVVDVVDRSQGSSVPFEPLFNSGDPSWAPTGDRIAYELTGASPAIVANLTPQSGLVALISGASDPAWRPLADTPPEIVFDVGDPTGTGWLGRDSTIGLRATDSDGITYLYCFVDGVFAWPRITDSGATFQVGEVLMGAEGDAVQVTCHAVDGRGTERVASTTVRVDLTGPTVPTATIDPSPMRVDQPALVDAPASDRLSGVAGGQLELIGSSGAQAPIAMTLVGSSLSCTIAANLPPDLYRVEIHALDRVGNFGLQATLYLPVYDPGAGTIRGSGRIVPGGSSSDPGDALPALDRDAKASFAFSAGYETLTSTTPTGFFDLRYGASFKFQSRKLSWLIVRSGTIAVLQGVATIRGTDGTFTFRATIQDGGSGGPDHLLLRVWPAGADPDSTSATYQSSGDVRGQIQIGT